MAPPLLWGSSLGFIRSKRSPPCDLSGSPVTACKLCSRFINLGTELSAGATKVIPLPADHTLDPDKAYLMLTMTQEKMSADEARRILLLVGSVPRSRSLPCLVKNISLVLGICMAGVGVRGLFRDDVDEEFRLGIELALVREALDPDLVPSIEEVADKLTEEDLLVGVEGVDDKTEELVDLGLERPGLPLGRPPSPLFSFFLFLDEDLEQEPSCVVTAGKES